MLIYRQVYKSPGRQVARATKLHMVAPNAFGS
jgi:hypothetical protein